MTKITKQSVFITGASRGLGLELTRQYAAAGWDVIATCRNPAGATALSRLGTGVERLDVADAESISSLAARLQGRAIDVLINNAGVYATRQRLGAIDGEEWAQVLRVNTIAPLQIAQAFMPNLLAGQRKLCAFLSSGMGSIANNGGGAYIYRSSKAPLNMAARSLAADLRGQGVIVVLLSPGWVKTDMGGAGAAITPATSVTGLRRVIEKMRIEDSGSFIDYTGAAIPW